MNIILFLLIIYIFICLTHGNLYEAFYPNEKQYTPCSKGDEKGETSLSIKDNKISKPEKGFFTSLIETTDEKDYSSYFRTPQCSLMNDISLNDFYGRKIVDYNDKLSPPLHDASKDQYSKPLDHYSVLYPPIFNDKFVDQHRKIIETDDRF